MWMAGMVLQYRRSQGGRLPLWHALRISCGRSTLVYAICFTGIPVAAVNGSETHSFNARPHIVLRGHVMTVKALDLSWKSN
jgi:hypothetical protein